MQEIFLKQKNKMKQLKTIIGDIRNFLESEKEDYYKPASTSPFSSSCRKIYAIPVVPVYEGSSLYSLLIFSNFSWFSMTVTAY